MKFFIQYFLIISGFLFSHQSILAQDLSGPIYASVAVDKHKATTPDKVDIKTNTDAYGVIADQIKQYARFPFEEGRFVNETRIVVELDIDESGRLKNTRVHNTQNKALIESLVDAISKLGTVSPLVINGEVVSKTLFVPICFRF